MDDLDKLGFSNSWSVVHKSKEEPVERLPFGFPYLDRVSGGFVRQDVVVISAPSGCGKTELAYTMIAAVAKAGYKAAAFCLEAEPMELENRTLYRELAEEYYRQGGTKYVNYLDWRYGNFPELSALKPKVMPKLEYLKNIRTFYRQGHFDVNVLEKNMAALKSKVDVILLDHLDFIDEDPNSHKGENHHKTEIMKKLGDFALKQGLPSIVVAHMKKLSRQEQILVGDASDLMGSSNIGKVATKIITLGTSGLDLATGYPITYVRLGKFRMAGERTKLIARTLFNTTTNSYEPKFSFGTLSDDQKRFEAINKAPHWLREKE